MFTVAKKKKVRTVPKPSQPQPKERSKPRSISVTKSKENIRLKTKQDQQPDESKLRNRAFMSLNEDVDGVDKRQYQTVNESDVRPRRTPIPRKTKTNSSHPHLLKGEPRKRQVASAMEVKRKSKDKLKPKKQKLANLSISRKPRLQISVDDLTNMEFGNADHLMSVTSSGDIVFSSQMQSRPSQDHRQDITTTVEKEQFEVDPNAMLRIMLRKEYKRKVAAVIKIQKIWRGYQTRKLLDRVITDIIKDYKPEAAEGRSSPSEQHFENFAPMKRSKAVNEDPSLSFNTAKISSDYPHQELADCSEIKPANYAMEEIPIINPNYAPEQSVQFQGFQQPPNLKATIQQPEFGSSQMPQQTDHTHEYCRDDGELEDGQVEEDQDDDEDDEVDPHLYRHRRAICSYEDIQGYWQDSHKQQEGEDNDDEQEDDIYDMDNQYFQHEIIMETNEQYLDSRKNSVHTRKTRTIESRKQSKDRDQALQVRKFSKEDSQLNHRKRSQEIESRRLSDIDNPQAKQISVQIVQHFPSNRKSPGKDKENMAANAINLLDRGETESTKEDYKEEVVRLKREEIDKWSRMIEMIRSSMKDSKDPQMELLLQQIMQQSEENKRWLEGHRPKESETLETRLTTREEELPSKPRFIFEQSKPERLISPSQVLKKKQPSHQQPAGNSKSMFRKKNLELDIDNIECTFKKEAPPEFIQGIKSRSDESRLSKQMEINWNLELQTSNKASTSKKSIKKILEQKMINLSTTNLNDIISVREQMLKERKESEQDKLRKLLSDKRIELAEFEHKINALLEYVQNEKSDIERARKDIEKGLRVAAQVAAKTQRDARILGKSIGMSKSADQLKKMQEFPLVFEPTDRLIVDEVPQRVRSRNFFCDDSASNSSGDSFNINEEDLKRWRDPKFGSLQLSDMNKNIMIEEFLKSQKTESYKNNFRKDIVPKEEPPEKQPELDSNTLRAEGNMIVDALVRRLIVESCYDILTSAGVYETIGTKLGMKTSKPKKVNRQEMFEFVDLVNKKLPPDETLLPRLNQQISPAPLQLLKCMRVDTAYDQEECSEQELGKYEFVIPQHCCTEAIREQESRQKQREEQAALAAELPLQNQDLTEEMKQFIQRRERSVKRRAHELRSMRHQVFNNEMHCIFDCWNEQIIQIKQLMPGFSGIGLNETTLSLQDHNVRVEVGEVSNYIRQAREKLSEILTDDSDVLQKIEMMSRQQICQNEGDWIYYADETLGLVLELDYLICDKFIDEVTRFLLARVQKAEKQRTVWEC